MDLAALLSNPKFQVFLFKIDRALAIKSKSGGCPRCGGTLSWANYQRKPRFAERTQEGAPTLRFSLCCSLDGCRRRLVPPSVRFLGRRVYAASAVAIASAAREGFVGDRFGCLRRSLGVTANTLRGWRKWWQDVVPTIRTGWSWAVGWLFPVVDTSTPPLVGLVKLMAAYGAAYGLVVFILANSAVTVSDLTSVHVF